MNFQRPRPGGCRRSGPGARCACVLGWSSKGSPTFDGRCRAATQHWAIQRDRGSPDPDDVGEDDAATRVARAVAGPGIRLDIASTGRCNLHAEAAGLLQLEIERIHACNQIDEAVTLATLPALSPLPPAGLAATIKIIPFAVPQTIVDRCVDIARGGLVSLRPFLPARVQVGLLLTRLPSVPESCSIAPPDRSAYGPSGWAERSLSKRAARMTKRPWPRRCSAWRLLAARSFGCWAPPRLSIAKTSSRPPSSGLVVALITSACRSIPATSCCWLAWARSRAGCTRLRALAATQRL